MIVLVPRSLHDELSQAAQAAAPEVELRPYDEEGAIDGLADACGILRWNSGRRFSEVVQRGPQIRWLHTASAGVDHVLTPEVRAKEGLVVTDSGAAFEIAISEFVLAWMLMVARRLPELLAHQRGCYWQGLAQEELYGKTAGIIGLGPIGRGVAARAKAFGMNTLGLRRHDEPVPSVDSVLTGAAGLEHLLRTSDYVVLAAALTDQTTALIGKPQLALMKPTSWLINIARGAMVDEGALVSALRAKQIAGACLDVFAQEPLPIDSPLWEMPDLYVAPHNSSGGSNSLRERQKAIFLDNLKRFGQGEPLVGKVDIAQGY